MVVPGMDRNRGRTSHQRESRFDSSRRKSDFGKRDSGKPTKQEDDRRSDAKDANENGADKSERKGQKIIVDAETGQKKFTGRCRLFVGNIPSDTKEDDFREMFKEHGESSEIFLNPSRGFGFIRLVSKSHSFWVIMYADCERSQSTVYRTFILFFCMILTFG